MKHRIIASLLIIGTVAAMAGGSTFALLNDTETSSTNTFQAGAFDLQMETRTFHNGEEVSNQQFGQNASPSFAMNDVKAGDVMEEEVKVRVVTNPARVNLNMTTDQARENGCTEPEAEAEGGDCGTEGEVYENMNVTVWMDNNSNRELDNGEEPMYQGSPTQFQNQSLRLDANPDSEVMSMFDNSEEYNIMIRNEVPRATGNEMQTDSGAVNFTFDAMQARHTNPNGSSTDY